MILSHKLNFYTRHISKTPLERSLKELSSQKGKTIFFSKMTSTGWFKKESSISPSFKKGKKNRTLPPSIFEFFFFIGSLYPKVHHIQKSHIIGHGKWVKMTFLEHPIFLEIHSYISLNLCCLLRNFFIQNVKIDELRLY